MKKQDFIDGLYAAGWQAPNDAQHTGIEKFWRMLFPCVASLEDDVKGLEDDIAEFVDAQPPI